MASSVLIDSESHSVFIKDSGVVIIPDGSDPSDCECCGTPADCTCDGTGSNVGLSGSFGTEYCTIYHPSPTDPCADAAHYRSSYGDFLFSQNSDYCRFAWSDAATSGRNSVVFVLLKISGTYAIGVNNTTTVSVSGMAGDWFCCGYALAVQTAPTGGCAATVTFATPASASCAGGHFSGSATATSGDFQFIDDSGGHACTPATITVSVT